MIVTVITPSIRPAGALRTAESVQAARQLVPDLEVRHTIAYWPGVRDGDHLRVGAWRTRLIAESAPGWLVFLDDDNLMHPQLLARLVELVAEYPQVWAFLFGMAFPALTTMYNRGIMPPQLPPRIGHIDGGQVALWRDYAVQTDWPASYVGDGLYLSNLYALASERWMCIHETLTAHNAQEWTCES